MNTKYILSISLFTILLIGVVSLDDAFATSYNLDQGFCEITMLGTWTTSDTCTITTQYTISVGNELIIPSGITLTVSNTGTNSVGIINYGTITNSGTIAVSNTNGYGIIVVSSGTITNSDTIAVSNTNGYGIHNGGTLTNSGDLTVSNYGGLGIFNYGTITNSDTITLSNTYGYGIQNLGGTLTNSGTITVSNSGGIGISNSGTLTNSGDLIQECNAIYSGIPTTGNQIIVIPCVVDSNPPVIVPTISGTLGNNGWYTSDVTVDWSVTDPESAFSSSGCEQIIINADTTGTTLTCTATSLGGTSSEIITIKVDETAPVIIAPVDVTIVSSTTTSPSLGTPTASDNFDSSIDITNDAPLSFDSETTTMVTWTATDDAGNSASATQQIVIQSPAQAVTSLQNTISSMNLPSGTATGLGATLNNLNTSNQNSTCGKLDAFENKVIANNTLTQTQKNQLLQQSAAIKTALSC